MNHARIGRRGALATSAAACAFAGFAWAELPRPTCMPIRGMGLEGFTFSDHRAVWPL